MSFGAYVRATREDQGVSLRTLARYLRYSPTYLSKVERDEFPPSTELVIRVAEFLCIPVDDLLARCGKVSPDLMTIIQRKPSTLPRLLRLLDCRTDHDVEKIIEGLQSEKVVR